MNHRPGCSPQKDYRAEERRGLGVAGDTAPATSDGCRLAQERTHAHALWMRWATCVLVCATLFVASRNAGADKPRAVAAHEQGTKAYNLRKYEEAIAHYERAYAEFPAPEFLFNLAQAYRQLDDCENAVQFYKRYLALKPSAKERIEVLGRIEDLEARCDRTAQNNPPEAAQTPELPTAATTDEAAPTPNRAATTTSAASMTSIAGTSEVTRDRDSARIALLAVEGGVAWLSAGPFDIPVQGAAQATIAHPIAISDSGFDLEVGAHLGISPMPIERGGETRTAIHFATMPQLAMSYGFWDRIRIRAGAGAGAAFLIGLEEGNPFTENGEANGTVTLFAARTALALEVAITSNIGITLTPIGLTWSPRTDRLAANIGGLRNIDATLGVALRL